MKKRRIDLEILRIISCFFVIASHTNNYLFDNLGKFDFTWFIAMAYHILSKVAVPIFFMVSGALYLNKEYSYKDMVKRVITRLLIPLFVFSSIIYCKRYPIVSFSNILNLFKMFFKGEILGTYWFIYTLIGLYLATPFLQKMFKNLVEKDFKAIIIYFIIFICIIPMLNRYKLFSIANELTIPLISSYITYYIIGGYVLNNYILLSKRRIIILLITSLISIVFGVVMSFVDRMYLGLIDYYYASFSSISIFILSVNICYFFVYIVKKYKISNKLEKIFTTIGSLTFGIYLLHALILGHTKFIYDFLVKILNFKFISLVLYQIIIFLLLVIITYCLKKIPVIKKII